jgi:hypothetical protein
MNPVGKFVVHHARFVIVATFVVTVAFAAAIVVRGIYFNGSPETLARHDDTLAFFYATRQDFGDDRVIIAALTTDDVFAPAFLEKLDRLTKQLAAAPGVAETQSLTNIKAIRRDADTIVIDNLTSLALDLSKRCERASANTQSRHRARPALRQAIHLRRRAHGCRQRLPQTLERKPDARRCRRDRTPGQRRCRHG